MSKIRDVVAKASATKDIAAETKEILQNLKEISELKGEAFCTAIEQDLTDGKISDGLYVSVTKVLRKETYCQAVTKESFSNIVEVIKTNVVDMITDSSTGGIVTGITNIVNGLVTMLTGMGAGEEQELRRYLVTADHMAIVRLDLGFWARKIAAESLTSYCESAITCVCYKSSVDVPKLSFNDFLALYTPILKAAYGDNMKQIDSMLEKSKNLYKKLGGKDTQNMADIGKLLSMPEVGLITSGPKKVDRGNF